MAMVVNSDLHAIAQELARPTSPATHPAQSTPATRPAASVARRILDAPEVERTTIDHLLQDSAWPRRAIAALRLERFTCDASRDMLIRLLNDTAWQVRTFALRTLARRHVPQQDSWLAADQDPRVIRDALRLHYTIEPARLQRWVRALARSTELQDKMLAAEIGAASGDKELVEMANNAAKQVILKMNRAQAGGFSSRLALLTGERDTYRPTDWQQWLMKTGRRFELQPAFAVESSREGADQSSSSRVAQLDPDQFAALDTYMTKLAERELDLAICLDCTASMGGELAAAQGGIDDLMLFVGDMVSSLRVAIVAYRDREDDFETKAGDFTGDSAETRRQLWQLSADGGGDTPEAVYPALKLAYTQLSWRPQSTKALVLIGDAPPHIGLGEPSINLARRARDEAQLTTHVIEAKNKDVKHFPEIAKAGGGRCVLLKNNDALVPEIAGLTLADRFEDEFREFFQMYLELCR